MDEVPARRGNSPPLAGGHGATATGSDENAVSAQANKVPAVQAANELPVEVWSSSSAPARTMPASTSGDAASFGRRERSSSAQAATGGQKPCLGRSRM